MKLYTFDNGDGVKRVGVELSGFPGLIRDVRDFGLPYRDMTDLIRHITPLEKERISDPEAALDGRPLRLSSVRVCSPIPHPEQDIICLGVNYAAHADESAQFDRKAFLLDRKKATYFSKRAYQTSGPDDLIPSYPELVTSLDYEAELAVIIGRDCKNVCERDAAACIFGYTVLNDVSARNLQTEHNQWYFGKSLDGFTRWVRASSPRTRSPIPRRSPSPLRSTASCARTAIRNTCCIPSPRSSPSCRRA